MSISLRTASLIAAALSASSVAPAQVGPAAEPLLPVASASLPQVVAPEALPIGGEAANILAPESDSEAAAPLSPSATLAEMVAELRSSDAGSRELECLAIGIFFESKGEPLIGQLAVGEVIANRAASGRFASTYCGVLTQRGQFSFVRRGKLPSVPRASRGWKTAVAIAKIVDQDLKDSAASDALFFHARRVSPRWKLKRVASIGNHVFYR